VVEAGRISEASTEAIGEVEACADVDEAVEEEAAVVREDCEWIHLRRNDSLRHTARGCTRQVKKLGNRFLWFHPPRGAVPRDATFVSQSACLDS
jgi:hypothetical protein